MTVPVVYKRKWADPEKTIAPPPVVPARAATEEEIPKGAKALIKLATPGGWTVIARYACGTDSVGRREPWKVVDSIVVEFRMKTKRGTKHIAVGHWIDGSFVCAFGLAWSDSKLVRLNAGALRLWLAAITAGAW